jgi:hypothetical protein
MNIESIFEWLGKLNGLPGYALVTVLCVVICAALAKWHRFPNDGIWLCSIVIGGAANAMIADPLSDNLPFRLWLWKNVFVGLICGGVAFLIYAAALKRFLAKVGVNGDTAFIAKDPPADSIDRKNNQ